MKMHLFYQHLLGWVCLPSRIIENGHLLVGNPEPKAFIPVYIGPPDLCCEQHNFGWIKIQNTSNDTLYRPYGLGVWTYYPGKIAKERYFNSDIQQSIEIYMNVNYNGNVASYSAMVYSAPNAAIIYDTIFVNL